MGEHKRKKRIEAIYGTTASAETTEIIVNYDHSTGQVSFGADMTNVYSEVAYDRPKGPKVLSRIPQAEKKLSFAGGDALKENFDFIAAVDTNTRHIGGKEISVTGVVIATPMMIPGPKGLAEYWKFDVPFCLEFTGVKTKPENLGWAAALEQFKVRGLVTEAIRIGLIVDSDLGNIPDYNSLKMEFLPRIMLPPSVQLIYASSDSGKENVANKILATADSVSSQSLEAIATGKVPPNKTTMESPWYETMRFITANVVSR
jgi:hypothetical protein